MITFSRNGDEGWYKPEEDEYAFEGDDPLIHYFLQNVSQFDNIDTDPEHTEIGHPGEVWTEPSPEERKEKVLNYLLRVNGVNIHE